MFKVGLTRDFLTPEGILTYTDMGLDILDKVPDIKYEFLEKWESPLQPETLQQYDAIISLSPAYTGGSFKNVTRLKAICRFGVGYDMVDVDACSKANVIVTITRGAVNYSVAEAIIAWMLALSHKLVAKNKLVREGKWLERNQYTGSELREKILGVIGFGGIGGQLTQMLKVFNMQQPLVYDPYISEEKAVALGVKKADLQTLLQNADFISVNCPLTPETKNLVDEEELALVKESAFIINTARGGIINEQALINTLTNKKIAGYATDVFEKEPVIESHPFFAMDNVLMAPHCIAWTNELFREIGRMACTQVVQVAQGKIPDHVLNTDITDQWYSEKIK
ncbi:MAG: NAD(P)-dependent oxidoreductase [Agriterribacter sp.]